MPVAIIDVGSNTARLLVVERTAAGVEAVYEERAYLGLGSLIAEHGELPADAIRDTARCVAKYARRAQKLGAQEVDVLVTSPGRQTANGDELLAALAGAGATVRLLSTEEEGRLAFEGVLSVCGPIEGLVAVCDVGGGSTQVVVGSADGGPAWILVPGCPASTSVSGSAWRRPRSSSGRSRSSPCQRSRSPALAWRMRSRRSRPS